MPGQLPAQVGHRAVGRAGPVVAGAPVDLLGQGERRDQATGTGSTASTVDTPAAPAESRTAGTASSGRVSGRTDQHGADVDPVHTGDQVRHHQALAVGGVVEAPSPATTRASWARCSTAPSTTTNFASSNAAWMLADELSGATAPGAVHRNARASAPPTCS